MRGRRKAVPGVSLFGRLFPCGRIVAVSSVPVLALRRIWHSVAGVCARHCAFAALRGGFPHGFGAPHLRHH
eukprot:12267316-Alexandrium_andersonii.AAC.1